MIDSMLQWGQDSYAKVEAGMKELRTLKGWRNEYVMEQFVFATGDSNLSGVEFSVEVDDDIWSSLHVIKSLKAYGGIPNPQTRVVPEGFRFDAYDIVTNDRSLDYLEAGSVQAIWLILKTDKEGKYSGYVRMSANELEEDLKIPFTYEVCSKNLDEATYKFDIEFWQNPYAVADYYNVEPFSKEHFDKLKPHMELYRDFGGDAVTTTIVEEAWDGQTYGKGEIKFPSMVTWNMDETGNFSLDFTNFEKWVTFCRDLGLGQKKVVCYSLAPWTNKLGYYDVGGEYKTIPFRVGSSNYDELVIFFLEELMKLCEEKGWVDVMYLGIDERGVDPHIFELVRSVKSSTGQTFKIASAIDGFVAKKDITPLVDDMTVGSVGVDEDVEAFLDTARDRKEKGLKTTIYFCTGHHPGNFALSAPVESYWSILYSYAHEVDGFLRWAYDSWLEEPFKDATHHWFEAGDTYLVYPEDENGKPQLSTRMLKFYEGLQDVRKLEYLRQDESLDKSITDKLEIFKKNYERADTYLKESEKERLAEDMRDFKEYLWEISCN